MENTNVVNGVAAYNDKEARPKYYEALGSFDPAEYLRLQTDDEGQQEKTLTLDIKFRRHWFRLVFPDGKNQTIIENINEKFALLRVRVFADKKDPDDQFLAEGVAIRHYNENGKAHEKFYVDWAETMALGRALSNAGFDLPWVNKPELQINWQTGEVTTTGTAPAAATAPAEAASPAAAAPPRKYPDVTAPPAEEPAAPAVSAPAPAPAAPPVAMTPAAQAPAATEQGDQSVIAEGPPALTVEQAKAVVIDFGRNKGKTLGQIAIESPSDIDWIAHSYKGKNNAAKIAAKLIVDTAKAS